METRSEVHGRNEEEVETMGKDDCKDYKRGCSGRSKARVERLAKLRGEEPAHLRWRDLVREVRSHFKRYGKKMALLPLMACPGCGFQWGDINVLQRPSSKRSYRKIPRPLDCEGVELGTNELNKGKSSER